MSEKKNDGLLHDHNDDGIDRRGFLKCMAWAGTGAFCVMKGGVLNSYSLGRMSEINTADMMGELSFVQISDSHMGFNKPANPDVAGTLKAAVDKINGLAAAPEFMLHTGDISHLSKPEEFDTVEQILKGAKPKDVFYVPGEHDVLNDDGKQLREERRALHRLGERYEFEGRWAGNTWPRPVRVVGRRREAFEEEHADRGVRTHSTVVCISGVGLGHRRQRASAGLPEEVRLCHGPERSHPPDNAKG